MDKPCCICAGPIDPHVDVHGEVFWTKGHNAEPVDRGRCCSACNSAVVIPIRVAGLITESAISGAAKALLLQSPHGNGAN